MWPILVLSICAVALVIERAISILVFHIKTNRFRSYLLSGGKEGSSPFPAVDEGFFGLSAGEADGVFEEAVQGAFDRLGRNVELLAGIGNVAPLLGFIGTVSGMISSFQSIAHADRVSVGLVAGGISEALITTGFGLIVAVVCISAEHLVRFYLLSRARRMEEEASALLSSLPRAGRETDEDTTAD